MNKTITNKTITLKTTIMALSAALSLPAVSQAEDVTLIIESWRNDDLTLWQDKIIPAFESSHEGIKVQFTVCPH